MSMSLDEYIAYCRSGQSTRDQRRRTTNLRNLGVTAVCELCGSPCKQNPDGLCGYCRAARHNAEQRKFDWETCTRCGRRCKWNTDHMCTRCRKRGTRKDSR
ncbi:hypothetical protein CSQ85_00310 [Bifidobacterium rousetti]|uniref:hypothetical protein n=1 Tax=Bifidobacterium rousetti TaxID=2045439 RepID=UPI00123A0486|nr:hypothetical protein [Bifidobacterium rousetti]KAA8820293.1 hypothetical protein CSQ85_00310 [Bifidobacterium rousetti]